MPLEKHGVSAAEQIVGRHGKLCHLNGPYTGYIENRLGKVRTIRVMPNLPVKIGKGMICLCKGHFATDDDLNFAKRLFDYMGTTMVIKEEMMNAATAISGSGPAFLYHLIQEKNDAREREEYAHSEFIPKLYEDAIKKGFTSAQAQLLAETTAIGSIALLKKTGLSPEILCKQVTSKGGTTEAGLKELHDIDTLSAATGAAIVRAEELSR